MFVSPARLTEVDHAAQNFELPLQSLLQKQISDLVQAAEVPENIQSGSRLDKLNWCIAALYEKCPEEMRKRTQFDCEILGQLLSLPSAMPLLQYCLFTLESHSPGSLNTETDPYKLLKSATWPTEGEFVKVAVLCAFSLFAPSVAIPCILQLYYPGPAMDSLISYLSTYFVTILSVCLHSKLDELLLESKSAPQADLFQRLSLVMSIMEIPRVFDAISRHWMESKSESTVKLEILSDWLLDLSDIALSSSNGSHLGLLPLIIENSNYDAKLLGNVLIKAGMRQGGGTEHIIFELATSHFFKGLISHICHHPNKSTLVLEKIAYWPNCEQWIPSQRLQEWRHFALVSSQYHSSTEQDQHIKSLTQAVIIEKSKHQAPATGFSVDTMKQLFSASSSSSSRRNDHYSGDLGANREKKSTSIENSSFEEIINILKNVWVLSQNSRSNVISLIPFDWLLALIDQGPFEVVFLAQTFIEMCLEHAAPMKIHLFSTQLLDYFESLAVAASMASNPPETTHASSNSNSMDIDNPPISTEEQETMKTQLPSINDKLNLIKGIILKLKTNRAVSTYLISDIVTRLCVGDISKVPHSLRAQSAYRFEESSSLSEESDSRSIISPNTTAQEQSGDILGNVRKRSHASISALETTSSGTSSVTPSYLKGSAIKKHHTSSGMEHLPSSVRSSGFSRDPLALDHQTSHWNAHTMDTSQPRAELFALVEVLALSTVPPPAMALSSSKTSTNSLTTPHKAPVGHGTSIANDLLPKIAETLVAQLDSRFPPIMNYELYFEILPKKSVYDRDRQVEQLFLQRPILWSILEIISTRSSLLHSCRHIILSLLVNLIGSWNAESNSMAAQQSFWFARTLILMRVMEACPSFGLGSTKQLSGIHVIFEYCQASDVTMILTALFHFIVKRLSSPVITSPLSHLDDRMWALKPIRFVLRRNIHILSEKALDFYLRTAAPSKPNQ
jgi:hypothetical protein